jgi:DNA helicase-2/ATP-dependent DNA helicase PcrA
LSAGSLAVACRTLRAAQRVESAWPAEFEELVGWYTPQLERLYDDAPMRLQDLAQLQNIAGTYRSRSSF